MPSSTVKEAVATSNASMERGDYASGLATLRDTWTENLDNNDKVLLVRTAGIIHMNEGQNDESKRRHSWKEAKKAFERAQKIDPNNKETRRQLNSLLSMMDEADIRFGRGFSLSANGEPTPFGLLAMFIGGLVLLAVFGQGREIIANFGNEETNEVYDGDTVLLTVSYTPQTGGQTVTDDIEIQLHPQEAPIHVASFLKHAQEGMYDQTTFHRIIDNIMIQGGDFQNSDGTGGYAADFYGYCNGQEYSNPQDCSETSYTLPDEANNGLKHDPCTISMAKTSAPHTGGSQFFLIPQDSTPSHLDGVHTVFGTITSGCEVVTSISQVQTGSNDRPSDPVNLESVTLL
mgnify:FL=1